MATVAEAVFAGSSTLIAVTVYVPGVCPAVYSPAPLIVPPVADHVTRGSVTSKTVAANCHFWPGPSLTEAGRTNTSARHWSSPAAAMPGESFGAVPQTTTVALPFVPG